MSDLAPPSSLTAPILHAWIVFLARSQVTVNQLPVFLKNKILEYFSFSILYDVLRHLENYKQTTADYLVPLETVDIFGSQPTALK